MLPDRSREWTSELAIANCSKQCRRVDEREQRGCNVAHTAEEHSPRWRHPCNSFRLCKNAKRRSGLHKTVA
jgi:hypothetical protein